MTSRAVKASAPLTCDLSHGLIAKIAAIRKGRGLKTASEAVRLAIAEFEFESCRPVHEAHQQISVRISPAQRALLRRQAKRTDTSVGELVRLALEALPVRAPRVRR